MVTEGEESFEMGIGVLVFVLAAPPSGRKRQNPQNLVGNLSRHELMEWIIIIANLHSKPMSLYTKFARKRDIGILRRGYIS